VAAGVRTTVNVRFYRIEWWSTIDRTQHIGCIDRDLGSLQEAFVRPGQPPGASARYLDSLREAGGGSSAHFH
jgi:hypothetical protein